MLTIRTSRRIETPCLKKILRKSRKTDQTTRLVSKNNLVRKVNLDAKVALEAISLMKLNFLQLLEFRMREAVIELDRKTRMKIHKSSRRLAAKRSRARRELSNTLIKSSNRLLDKTLQVRDVPILWLLRKKTCK